MTGLALEGDSALCVTLARAIRFFPAIGRTEFRWYWLGMFTYSFGMQSRMVITGWLIYQLTGSALSLGWYIGTWGVAAFLFSLVGGAFGDRLAPRRVVIAFRILAGSGLLLIYALWVTGYLHLWHMLVFNFFNGLVSAFEYPARTALVSQIIPREDLTSTFGLSYMAMNLASIIGPASMGFVTEGLGAEWTLLIMGAIMVLGGVFVLPVHSGDGADDGVATRETVLRDTIQGVRYIWENKALLAVEACLFIYVVFLVPYRDMMPAVAQDVLGVGASGLGLLTSAVSVGGLLGTLVVSAKGELRPRGLFLLGSALLEGVGVAFFARSRVFGLSLLLLAAAGLGRGLFIPLNNTLLQVYARREMRARAVGMNMFIWSLQPFGSIALGALSDRLGPSIAIFGAALTGAGLLLVSGLSSARLRRLE